jgi:multimeric flavodoxin WrbA
MKLAVLNGSPKGTPSATLQYALYIQKHHPQHEFKIIHVAREIDRLANDAAAFQSVLSEIRDCDGVLWVFPLYHLLVPAQLKRFIELVFARGGEAVCAGKYAAAITTSVHFMDHTAHNYLQAVCEDLQMKYVDSFSGREELLTVEGRRTLLLFARSIFEAIETRAPVQAAFMRPSKRSFEYAPGPLGRKISPGNCKITLVTDDTGDSNIARMVRRFAGRFTAGVEIVDLSKLKIGWCRECLHCGYDNQCIYAGSPSDEFIGMFERAIKPADIIVFAGAIQDRYLSHYFKVYFDRSFYMTHLPFYQDKQMAFLVSGPLRQIPNLWQILSAYPEFHCANSAGVVTDESGDSQAIDALLDTMAERLIKGAESHYIKPQTFLGVAGRRIIRDEAWGNLRFLFQADHKYYAAHGLYDFPYKRPGKLIFSFLAYYLLKIRFVRDRFRRAMPVQALKPFKTAVAAH